MGEKENIITYFIVILYTVIISVAYWKCEKFAEVKGQDSCKQ